MMHLYCDFLKKSLPLNVSYHSSLLSVYIFLENFLLLICCRFRNQALDSARMVCELRVSGPEQEGLMSKTNGLEGRLSAAAASSLLTLVMDPRDMGPEPVVFTTSSRARVVIPSTPPPTPASPCRMPGALSSPLAGHPTYPWSLTSPPPNTPPASFQRTNLITCLHSLKPLAVSAEFRLKPNSLA